MRKDILLVFVSAIALILSFAPFNLSFLSWIGLFPLFLAIGNGKRGVIYKLLLWGVIFYGGTTYWIVNSMHYYGGIPLYSGLFILLLLIAYMSIYPLIFGLGLNLMSPLNSIARITALSSLWVVLEYLRGHLFTGFPWVLMGYSQVSFLPVIQIADITGVYGISFLIVFVNLSLSEALKDYRQTGRVPSRHFLLIIILIVPVVLYGYFSIRYFDRETRGWDRIKAGVIQGNIHQSIKWDSNNRQRTLDIYRSLSINAAKEGTYFMVWPETAIPFFLQSDRKGLSSLYNIAKETNNYIIAGSPSYERRGSRLLYFNSAFLIGPKGMVGTRYDKVHLVPFGEYVPLGKILFFINKLTSGVGNFTPGKQIKPLILRGNLSGSKEFIKPMSVGVMICFESIFPGIGRKLTLNGANILAVITNDAWFGKTSAPFQHFDISIIRAVENRLFLLRSANTGISGIISPTGKVLSRSSLNSPGFLTEEVGLRRKDTMSFYARFGDIFVVLTTAITFSALILAGNKRRSMAKEREV